MKKIIGLLLILGIAFGISIYATDPNVKRKVEAERAAKRQAEKEKADRKQKEWNDGWAKWMEEGKRKTDERVKQANEPGFDDGFRLGYMGGKVTRSKTKQPVSAKRVTALAWEAVEKQQVAVEVQNGFVRGFTAGWDFGWIGK